MFIKKTIAFLLLIIFSQGAFDVVAAEKAVIRSCTCYQSGLVEEPLRGIVRVPANKGIGTSGKVAIAALIVSAVSFVGIWLFSFLRKDGLPFEVKGQPNILAGWKGSECRYKINENPLSVYFLCPDGNLSGTKEFAGSCIVVVVRPSSMSDKMMFEDKAVTNFFKDRLDISKGTWDSVDGFAIVQAEKEFIVKAFPGKNATEQAKKSLQNIEQSLMINGETVCLGAKE
ncbi:MAG: hypothetical protein JW725_02070 [Candidatus Babeliaceae bacterium]|nr:hypothetical protein [Candidatus Babeliaceae bacterium]